MTTGLASRAIRAATFAAVCVAAASAGHSLVSGAALPPFALGSAFAGTASAAWWLAGRERGAFTVTGATVAAQLGLHLLFSLTQRHPAAAPVHGHAGHIPGAAPTLPPGQAPPLGQPDAAGAASVVQPPGDALAGTHGGPGSGELAGLAGLSPFCHGWGMLLAHVVAAVACGLWLWRGERAAFRLGRALAAAVFVPLRTAFSGLTAGPWTRPRLPRPGPRRRCRPRRVFLRHVLDGRAPPPRVAPC